jgi:hypothetical protein
MAQRSHRTESGSGSRCEARGVGNINGDNASHRSRPSGRWARTVNTRPDKHVARMIADARESLATVRNAVAGLREFPAKDDQAHGIQAPIPPHEIATGCSYNRGYGDRNPRSEEFPVETGRGRSGRTRSISHQPGAPSGADDRRSASAVTDAGARVPQGQDSPLSGMGFDRRGPENRRYIRGAVSMTLSQ